MPKSVREYSLRDWRRLRPITHSLKTWRYRYINRLYVVRPARLGDLTVIRRAIADRDVLVTIAFNDPQAIVWQSQLIQKYVPRALHVIVDNSSDAAASEEIANIAISRAMHYLRLPHNPWRSFSRSHGIALNWVWRNVLLPGRPRAFGFIDDDLFPTAPDNPFAPLDTQNFFGLIREYGERWFLWAGYCMFLFNAVEDKPLDFGQDWFIGLDTGGANWNVLYRYVNRSELKEPQSNFVPYKAGIGVREGPIQWCNTWLHEVGTMGDAGLAHEKRRYVAKILCPHLK
jgi:hypothetical protein